MVNEELKIFDNDEFGNKVPFPSRLRNKHRMNAVEIFDNIELKIQQLAQKLERLSEENIALKQTNEQLKEELDRQKGSVNALQEKLTLAQVSIDAKLEEKVENTKQLKHEIDQYIVEIDRCIEWLHNN